MGWDGWLRSQGAVCQHGRNKNWGGAQCSVGFPKLTFGEQHKTGGGMELTVAKGESESIGSGRSSSELEEGRRPEGRRVGGRGRARQ